MGFTKSPIGADSNYSLTGTEFRDVTTIPGSNDNVSLTASAGNDQVTLQNTDGVMLGFTAALGAGEDQLRIDADPNFNTGSMMLSSASIQAGFGNDILFGDFADVSQIATGRRTPYFLNSYIQGNEGNDLIRTLGVLNSRVEGGKDNDTIDLRNTRIGSSGVNLIAYGATTTAADTDSPDRYDSGLIQGSRGQDTIEIALGDTNVVATEINGNEDDDVIRNRGTELSGLWDRSSIFGGQGQDSIDLQVNVTSSLFISGDRGYDTIRSGQGNDTVIGGLGNDSISITDGNNLVYGDNLSGDNTDSTFFDDTIEIGTVLPTTPIVANGSNTVFAQEGNDNVTVRTNGNNVVSGFSGNDTIRVEGSGSNTVSAGIGNDTVNIVGTGSGSNTVSGEAGNDKITFTGTGDVYASGSTGNDTINALDVTSYGTASVYGGVGADSILFDSSSNIDRNIAVQLNGDSIAATSVGDVGSGNANTWGIGDTVTFANGIDTITNWTAANGIDVLQTTLGDNGLDQSTGNVYAALGKDINNGMVAQRTYFLDGNLVAGVFTVAAINQAAGFGTLLVTEGNNASLTSNTNSVFIAGNSGTALGFANFETYNGAII